MYEPNQQAYYELYHYGILGMKWGVRRNRSNSNAKRAQRIKKLDEQLNKERRSAVLRSKEYSLSAELKNVRTANRALKNPMASTKSKRDAQMRLRLGAEKYEKIRSQKVKKDYKVQSSAVEKGVSSGVTKGVSTVTSKAVEKSILAAFGIGKKYLTKKVKP